MDDKSVLKETYADTSEAIYIEIEKTSLFKRLHLMNMTGRQLLELEKAKMIPKTTIAEHNWMKTKLTTIINAFESINTSYREVLDYDSEIDNGYIPKVDSIHVFNVFSEPIHDYYPFPPLRFATDFSIFQAKLGYTVASTQIEYAGSKWCLAAVFIDSKLSFYLKRSASSFEFISDKRSGIMALVQIFCFLKTCHVFKSKIQLYKDNENVCYSMDSTLSSELLEMTDESTMRCSVVIAYI